MLLPRICRFFPAMIVGIAICAAASPVRADQADELFDKANAAYDAGRYQEALERFEAVWKVRKTHDLAATMAQTEVKLGKYAPAAQHIAYALAHFPLTGKPEVQRRMEETLTGLKTKVATVRARADVSSATFAIDGVAIDPTLMGSELYLLPGKHDIEANAKGYHPARRTFEATAGKSVDIDLTLVPIAPPTERSMVPPAIAFGVGGAGLVMSAVAGGIAAAKFEDVKKSCRESLSCPDRLRGEVDAINTAAHLSTAGAIVAGVGAAVGVTFLLLPQKKTPAAVGLKLGPSFIGVKGSF